MQIGNLQTEQTDQFNRNSFFKSALHGHIRPKIERESRLHPFFRHFYQLSALQGWIKWVYIWPIFFVIKQTPSFMMDVSAFVSYLNQEKSVTFTF